jgi:2-iminobutanoate/2-iminopropanoate deaminase
MARKIEWNQVGVTSGHALLSPGFICSKDEDILFTSGNVGTDPKSGEVPEDLRAQAKNALENLKTTLEAGGSSLDNVLKVLLFVADGSYAATVNEVYKEYFPGSPARSCIVVSFPDPKLKLELECIAAVPSS